MLGWLAAAAAPLVIHLLNRRKHREVEWAAMTWLLAAWRKNSKRIRIEQWILLAVRTLIILCVVLAFTEPYLERIGFTLSGGQRHHRVFVVDGSFSMGLVSEDKTHFQRAKELITEIVDASPEGDAFSLVLMSAPARTIVGNPAFDAVEFLQEIENLKLPHGGMDLPASLTRVEEILRRTRNDHPRLSQQEVYLFSDLQRVGWMPEKNGAQASDLRRSAERISRLALLHLFDVSRENQANSAITDLRLYESMATTRRNLTAEVEVRNFGGANAPEKVAFLVDGRQVSEETTQTTPDGTALVTFNYRFDTAGEHQIEARLAQDALDLDNHRWFALPVRDAIQVLCVNGKPGTGSFGQATDYLSVALAPDNELGHATIRPTVISESALLETALDQYDCIFFCNVGQFTAAEARVLERYLSGGGGLVFFLGDQVQPASYNRFLGGEEPGIARLLPATIGRAVDEGDYRLNPLGYRHPLLNVFRGQEQSGLINAPIQRYFQLTPAPRTSARVALALSSDDPIIVEERVGRGEVILVATTADTSWNMLPVLPSYVPLAHELLNLATRGRFSQRNNLVGQPLGEDFPDASHETQVEIDLPNGEHQSIRSLSGEHAWQFSETSQSGVYTAHFGPRENPQVFAVNIDPSESDLTPLSVNQIRNEVWPGVEFDFYSTTSSPSVQPEVVRKHSGKLNLYLLYTALALLLTEPLLAWYFGHRRL